MLAVLRRRRSGQAIVIMALAMVAICGMLALAIDAGRLYFQRRLMQDAVDSGALAGAQSLVATNANPNGQPNYALYYALDDTFAVFNQNPANNDPTSSFYTAPANNTVTDTQGGYTVTAVAPSGYNNKQVQVTVSFNAVATFVQVLGIAQIDDGQDGADVCDASASGLTLSNAKFHVPNPTQASLNVNGHLTVYAASDNHALYQYWQSPTPFGSGQDPEPDYLMPDTSAIPMALPRTKIGNNIAPGTSAGVVQGVTIWNHTSATRDIYVYYPGKYTTTLNVPDRPRGDPPSALYVFMNGIYYFTSGASLLTTGGYMGNTSDAQPHYATASPSYGRTDLPPAADGTNGIEFIIDGGGAY